MPVRLLLMAGLSLSAIANTAFAQDSKPTIVLVHGAFAESSSWNGVLTELVAKGYPTVAVANPLRGVKSDAAYVSAVLDTIEGPIVLVGHSYGGTVITNAKSANNNIKALVYVSAFAPDLGETASELSSRYPGSSLGATLAPPIPLPGGGKDLYGDLDLHIPPAALAFMAKRASSKETIVIKGASHVVMVSHPDAVAKVIEHAAVAK